MYSCSYQGYKRKWNESEPRSGGDANSGTHSQVSLADVHIFWCNGAALFRRKPTLLDTVSLMVYFTCISHPGWLQHLLGSSLVDSDAAVDLTKFLSSHILHSYGKIGLINKVIPDNEMLWEKKGQCVPIESDLLRVMVAGTTSQGGHISADSWMMRTRQPRGRAFQLEGTGIPKALSLKGPWHL